LFSFLHGYMVKKKAKAKAKAEAEAKAKIAKLH
jgi:hypothetical protein